MVAASRFVVVPFHSGLMQRDVLVCHFDGFAQQGGDAGAAACHGGKERHAEPFRQLVDVKFAMAFLKFVEHVQGAHERHVAFFQLQGKQQVAFQVGRVEHIDDGVNPSAFQFVCHVGFFGTEGAEGISARQVHQADLPSFERHASHDAAYRHAAVIPRAFVSARSGVEERGFPAVRVTHQGYGDFAFFFRRVGRDVFPFRAATRAIAFRAGCWCFRVFAPVAFGCVAVGGEHPSRLTVFPQTNPISLSLALNGPLPSMCEITTVSPVPTSAKFLIGVNDKLFQGAKLRAFRRGGNT